MSLNTVLHIGHEFNPENSKERSSKWIQNFRFVSSPEDLSNTLCFSVDVDKNFNIDWSSLIEIEENNKTGFCYFVNKTSNNDTQTSPIYLFGDIFYSNSNGKEVSDRFKIFDKKNSIKLLKDSLKESNKQKNPLSYFTENKEDFESLREIVLREKVLPENQSPFNPLILFWRQIIKEKENIEFLLKFAPVIKCCMTDFTREREKIEDEYKLYVFEKRENINQAKKVIKNWLTKYNKDQKGKNKIEDNAKLDYSKLPEETKSSFLECFNHSVFLHFKFHGDKKNWYEQEECCKIIYGDLIKKIAKKREGNRCVLTKSVYPTVCTADEKNDIQFPSFEVNKQYNSFYLNGESELFDLLYADGILKRYRQTIKRTNIRILVLPRSIKGDAIPVEKLESFFYDNETEQSLFSTNMFDCFDNDKSEEQSIVFDFIFVDIGGRTDNYLLEVSGLQKSILKRIEEKHQECSRKISGNAEEIFGGQRYTIEKAMTCLIGIANINEDGTIFFSNQIKKDGKRVPYPVYQSHMIKVVSRIYQEQYYSDALLLPSMIKQTEYCIRNHKSSFLGDQSSYNLTQCFYRLKYSLQFMLEIQNNKKNKYMEIINSECYLLGKSLGDIAKPLGRKINSFQKNYVGMLTRRASSKEDCIILINDIIEKLVMHECTYQISSCGALLEDFTKLQSFDKEIFALGFFEGYFKYTVNNSVDKFIERTEKLLADFSETEEVKEASSVIKEAIDNLKN